MADIIIPEPLAIVTRSEAISLNLKRFFTGEPCSHGHIASRQVCGSSCSECGRLAAAARYHADPGKAKAYLNAYRKSRYVRSTPPPKPRIEITDGMKPFISRKEALASGVDRYFTGIPCIKDHISDRMVVNWHCVTCEIERAKETREHRNDLQRKRWPVTRETGLAASRAWKSANKERMASTQAAYRLANPDWWKGRDPVRTREAKVRSEAKRRAQKLNCEVVATTDEIKALLIKQKHKCGWCSCSIKEGRELDHIQPLSRGGSHSIRNLIWSCRSCNRKKRSTDPIIWARKLGKLI